MNSRLVLGLAVGAGYVLGRTKKAKLAFGIGTMVVGRKLQPSRAFAEFATAQLRDNPQFKEIRDQLREDFCGVGKAATGALLTRQVDALADRLHTRTQDVQDRISGVVPEAPDLRDEEEEPEEESLREEDEPSKVERSKAREKGGAPPRKTVARKSSAKKPVTSARRATKKAAAKKTAPKGGRSRG